LIANPSAGLVVLLTAAVILGGGGVGAGLLNLAVQLLAIALLALHSDRLLDWLEHGPRPLVWLLGLSLSLPLLQSIPLPPAIWQALPGRELVAESFSLIGAEDAWFPLSVDVARTLTAALSLLPAIAIVVLAHGMDRRQGARALIALGALGMLNIALGLVQMSTANRLGNIHVETDIARVYGTFANYSTSALFLNVALIGLVAGIRCSGRERALYWVAAAAVPVFAIATVLTRSRSGTVLLVAALIASAVAWFWKPGGAKGASGAAAGGRARGVLLPFALLLCIPVGAVLLGTSEQARATFQRFSLDGDNRTPIWRDAAQAVGRYFPVGSGTGTFDEVFQVDESLEVVAQTKTGRAHSDWLEVLSDSGVAGGALALAWLIYLAMAAWRARTMSDAPLRIACASGLALVILQSAADFPLRNQAFLCVAALLVSLLCRPRNPDGCQVQPARAGID